MSEAQAAVPRPGVGRASNVGRARLASARNSVRWVFASVRGGPGVGGSRRHEVRVPAPAPSAQSRPAAVVPSGGRRRPSSVAVMDGCTLAIEHTRSGAPPAAPRKPQLLVILPLAAFYDLCAVSAGVQQTNSIVRLVHSGLWLKRGFIQSKSAALETTPSTTVTAAALLLPLGHAVDRVRGRAGPVDADPIGAAAVARRPRLRCRAATDRAGVGPAHGAAGGRRGGDRRRPAGAERGGPAAARDRGGVR